MIKLLSLSPAWVERSVDRLFQILGGLLVALGDADKADVVSISAISNPVTSISTSISDQNPEAQSPAAPGPTRPFSASL
jgi:hypothetical protein